MSYTQQLARLGQDTLANLQTAYAGQFVRGMLYEISDKNTYGIGLSDNSLSLLMTKFSISDGANAPTEIGHLDTFRLNGLNKIKATKNGLGIDFDFDLTGAADYQVLQKFGAQVQWANPVSVHPDSSGLISIDSQNRVKVEALLMQNRVVDTVQTSLSNWIANSGYLATTDVDVLILTNVSDGNGGAKLEMWLQKTSGLVGTTADFVLASVDVTDAYVKALFSAGEGLDYANGEFALEYLRRNGVELEYDNGSGWRKVWTQNEFGTADVANWNAAHGWGNHASAGYAAASHQHTIADITDLSATDVTNWNTAFGWGNHYGLYSVLGHTHTLSQITDLNSTTDLSEGTNLYFTNARVQGVVTKGYADGLGINAATLGGNSPSYYLNPSNFNWGLSTNYLPIFNGSTLNNSIASQIGTEFRVAGLFRGSGNDTGTIFKGVNASAGSLDQFYVKNNFTNVEVGNLRGTLKLLSNTAGASLELGTQLTSTVNLDMTTKYALFQHPTTWTNKLQVGGSRTGVATTTSAIITTNGSVHIDAASTSTLYFNYYQGINTIFGNGSGAGVARMSNTGQLYQTASGSGTDGIYWNINNHGTGSGLDADLLDGQHGSYYTNTSNMAWGLASGKLPYFNGTTLVDSIVSQSGTMATVTGNATVTNGLTVSSALNIGSNASGFLTGGGGTLMHLKGLIIGLNSGDGSNNASLGSSTYPFNAIASRYMYASQALSAGTHTPNLANNVKLNVAGLISGGTYETSYRNLLDLSANATRASIKSAFSLGSYIEQTELGSGDLNIILNPQLTSKFSTIRGDNSVKFKIDTWNTPLLSLSVNAVEQMLFSSTLATVTNQIKGLAYADGNDDSTVVTTVVGLKTDGTFIRKRVSDFADQIIEDSITPTTRTVTATAHGLSLFDVVYWKGTAFEKAIATNLSTARKANEIVIEVIDANTVKVAGSGYVKATAHGFDVGELSYALSTTTAGAVVIEDTLTLGTDVVWRVFRAVDANTILINIHQLYY